MSVGAERKSLEIYSERERVGQAVSAISDAVMHRAEIYLDLWCDRTVGFVPWANSKPLYGQFLLFPTIRESFQQVVLTELPKEIHKILEREEAKINFSVPIKRDKPVSLSLVFTKPPEGVEELRKKMKVEVLAKISESTKDEKLKQAYIGKAGTWRKIVFERMEVSWNLTREQFRRVLVSEILLGHSLPISAEEIEEVMAREGLLKQDRDKKAEKGLIGRELEVVCETVYKIPKAPFSGEYALVVKKSAESITIALEAIKQRKSRQESKILALMEQPA